MVAHPDRTQQPAEPLVCRRCGAITIPREAPGTGPHALKAHCPDCGGFMMWVSCFTPEERATRREQARQEALAKLAPTEPQLRYLRALGDNGASPVNRVEASQRIDQIKRERGVV